LSGYLETDFLQKENVSDFLREDERIMRIKGAGGRSESDEDLTHFIHYIKLDT
jgi:hypothetical protein